MLKLQDLKPYKGATKRAKTVGRGLGSAHGTYSGRGIKGQLARSGSSMPAGFEGGRMPLHRQIPKRRGFKSALEKATALNLDILEKKFNSGETVNPKLLYKKGLISSAATKVKILGEGELKKSLNFEGVLVSKIAGEKIAKAGGKVAGPATAK